MAHLSAKVRVSVLFSSFSNSQVCGFCVICVRYSVGRLCKLWEHITQTKNFCVRHRSWGCALCLASAECSSWQGCVGCIYRLPPRHTKAPGAYFVCAFSFASIPNDASCQVAADLVSQAETGIDLLLTYHRPGARHRSMIGEYFVVCMLAH
jgi:hypothetical protein